MKQAFVETQPYFAAKRLSRGRRWCHATILWIDRTADHPLGEAYTVEFRDGSRGSFDLAHLRRGEESKPLPKD